MKTTSIFIPLLIIGCLAALIYLFYAALQATEAAETVNTAPIVLNQADYAEDTPEDLGDNVNLEPYFQEVPEEEEETAAATEDYTEVTTEPRNSPENGSSAAAAATTAAPAVTRTTTTGTGRYLVIAGSFRQVTGAEERARALRSAGFTDTSVERFNRGAFAVAMAGQSDRYSEAVSLAGRLRAAGFEARVMRRR